MLHPETGVLRDPQLRFNPIGVCADWLEFRMPQPKPYQRPALPRPEYTPPTPEERERNYQKLMEAKRKMLSRANWPGKKEGKPSCLTPTEQARLDRYIADPNTP